MKSDVSSKILFPTTARIKRVVEAARAAGIDVASIEVIDNSIQVFDARIMPALPNPTDEFAKWDMDGRL